MSYPIREYRKETYFISTDKKAIDLKAVHKFLSEESYWAKNIPLSLVEKGIENSLTFSLQANRRQIGFARVISDFATFAYLADVYIIEEYRGKGLSKWLMSCIMDFPELQGLRRWMLITNDAHGLYKQYAFKHLHYPERAMEITQPDIYNSLTNS